MQITKTFDVDLTPEQIAEAFCEIDATDQARFFNHVCNVSNDWGSGMFEKQMAAVSHNNALDTGGKSVMRIIGGIE